MTESELRRRIMGWTSYQAKYFKNGRIDRKKECDETWACEKNFEVVKSRLIGSVWYAAVKEKESGKVFAVIFLTSVDGYEFCYKDMTENAGPYNYDCPESILKLLSPTDNEYALEWRQKCRKKAEQKRKLEHLPIGTKIVVHGNFVHGGECDKVFTKRHNGRSAWQDGFYYITKGTILSLGYKVKEA